MPNMCSRIWFTLTNVAKALTGVSVYNENQEKITCKLGGQGESSERIMYQHK